MVAAEIGVRVPRIVLLLVPVAALGAYIFLVEVPKARKEGEKDKLLGKLQERYGWSREQAERDATEYFGRTAR